MVMQSMRPGCGFTGSIPAGGIPVDQHDPGLGRGRGHAARPRRKTSADHPAAAGAMSAAYRGAAPAAPLPRPGRQTLLRGPRHRIHVEHAPELGPSVVPFSPVPRSLPKVFTVARGLSAAAAQRPGSIATLQHTDIASGPPASPSLTFYACCQRRIEPRRVRRGLDGDCSSLQTCDNQPVNGRTTAGRS